MPPSTSSSVNPNVILLSAYPYFDLHPQHDDLSGAAGHHCAPAGHRVQPCHGSRS